MATGDITGIMPEWDEEFKEIARIRGRLENEDGNLSSVEVRQLQAQLVGLERKVHPQWGR